MKMKSCSLTIVCVIILVVILFMMFSGSNNNMYGLIEGMKTAKNTTQDKNKNINPQDLFSSEVNQIKDKLQNLSNNMTIPKNIIVPPTKQNLITVADSTNNLIIPPTNN